MENQNTHAMQAGQGRGEKYMDRSHNSAIPHLQRHQGLLQRQPTD